jgi:AcrR family transcriptional regulator
MKISHHANKPLPVTRHREKTELTRARLIQAAEMIFARDGFEAAKLEDIAAEAGYTRGALYANFESKEDLFLAMLEEKIVQRMQQLREHISRHDQPAKKLGAFRNFWLGLCQDQQWSILTLEFKLFAVRHPEVKARLAALHRRMVSSGVDLLEEIVHGLDRQLPISAHAMGVAFFALSSGLTLEHMLYRNVISEEAMRTVMVTFFNALTGV